MCQHCNSHGIHFIVLQLLQYSEVDTVVVTVLTHSCLKFSNMSLFTMHVVTCIQTYNLDIVQHTILHRTHQYLPHGLDPLGSKTPRLGYIYVATCIVSKGILNFQPRMCQHCNSFSIYIVFVAAILCILHFNTLLIECPFNPLMPELNPSQQGCLPEFFYWGI